MYGGHFLVSWSLTAPSSRPWSSRQPLAASLDPYSGFLWIKPPYHTPPRLDPRLPTLRPRGGAGNTSRCDPQWGRGIERTGAQLKSPRGQHCQGLAQGLCPGLGEVGVGVRGTNSPGSRAGLDRGGGRC